MTGTTLAHSVVEPSPWSRRLAALLVVGYALLTMVPLAWIFLTAIKSGPDSISYPPKLAFTPSAEGFCNLFQTRSRQTDEYIASLPPPTGTCDRLARAHNMVLVGPSNYAPRFVNSLIIAFGSTALSVLLGVTAAYAFSRFRVPLKDDLLFFILSTRMMPPIAVAIPIYLMYRELGLSDTRLGMILLYTAVNVSLAVWLLKGFIDEIPREYEEAALVDGYTRLQAFFKVVLPQATTGIVATAIFCLIFAWNEYAFAVLLTSGEAQTAPPFIPIIIGEGGQDWPANDPGTCSRDAAPALAALAAPRSHGDIRHGADRPGRADAAAAVLDRAVQVLVRDHARRHGAVHRRRALSRLTRPPPGAPMAEIRVDHLHKRFGEFVAVRDSSFSVRDGEFFCLLGPSGCGKTTTMRMIAGLELPTQGSIRLAGKDVTMQRASQRDIAFVFQLFALYPHMNVRANIAFPLKSQGVAAAQIGARVAEVARILRITHLLDQPVAGLSSGDRQRVALGRAIVRQPQAFMMDEPLGALDAEFRQLMCGELRALHDRLHATTVYVTHDQLEAMAMADTIAVMNHGVIEQLGRPQDIYDRPATMFVADFIGSPAMNFLPCVPSEAGLARGASRVRVDGAVVAMPALAEDAADGDLALGVRPEHIELSADAPLRARVFGVEYLGTTQIVTLQLADGTRVKARVPSAVRAATGDQTGLRLRGERLSLFRCGDGRVLRSALHEARRSHG
jgi:multiple sugar transport system ATP-binding protein